MVNPSRNGGCLMQFLLVLVARQAGLNPTWTTFSNKGFLNNNYYILVSFDK